MSIRTAPSLRKKQGHIVHISITYYYAQVEWDIGNHLLIRDVFPDHDQPHGTMEAKTALIGRNEDVLTDAHADLLTGNDALFRLSPQNEVIDLLPVA